MILKLPYAYVKYFTQIMVRENARGRNAKISNPWIYYMSKNEEKAQEEMIKGYGAEYGKIGDKRLDMEDTGKR